VSENKGRKHEMRKNIHVPYEDTLICNMAKAHTIPYCLDLSHLHGTLEPNLLGISSTRRVHECDGGIVD
jgi:hypothetical protein